MNKNKNKGFTFIELILYMAILGIFMVAVMTLISTTVVTQKKQRSRQKLQTQATETYDTISSMIMGAKDIRIVTSKEEDKLNADGSAILDADGNPEKTHVSRSYVVPQKTQIVDKNGAINVAGGKLLMKDTTGKSYDCYDISTLTGNITADYLFISYSPANDHTAFCTIQYDSDKKVLYIARAADKDNPDSTSISDEKLNANPDLYTTTYNKYIDGSSMKGNVLAKNVSGFKVEVNPDDNSVNLEIGFYDSSTNQSYSVNGVVGIRNSYVLKQHKWN